MKRFALPLFVLGALTVGAFLALSRPGAQASPDPTITVNSTADTNTRDSVITLREAIMLATGGPLHKYDAFLILVTAPVSCTMPIGP